MNTKEIFNRFIKEIKINESSDEISALAFATLDHFGISRNAILTQEEVSTPWEDIERIIDRLNKNEPLQYIFHEAWFYGRKFYVDPSVLIPRPETELLIDQCKQIKAQPKQILDIGTGSGCIAITIALEFPQARVTAVDISEPALSVAQQNAKSLSASVDFFRIDILKEYPPGEMYDLIVSNPPYIGTDEKMRLPQNVLLFEPEIAIFADNDPLAFYKRIASLAQKKLIKGGCLLMEINERYGDEVIFIFKSNGFHNSSIIKDLSGKNRIVFISSD